MDIKYKVEKLHCLNVMDYVEIKPITLLVGLNNSGKSSFLRSLPLLKQSVESKFNSPISWREDIVNFGSFSDAISKKRCQEENNYEIKFCFNISNLEFTVNSSNSDFFRHMLQNFNINESLPNVNYEVSITESIENECFGKTILKYVKITIPKIDAEYLAVYSKDGNFIENIYINDACIFDLLNIIRMTPIDNCIFSSEFSIEFRKKTEGVADIVDIVCEIEHLLNADVPFKSQDILFSDELTKVLKKYLKKVSENPTSNKMTQSSFNQYWKGLEDYERDILFYLSYFYLFFIIMKITSVVLGSFMSQMSYLAPVRANYARYLPFQENGVGHIEPQGKNLPLFFDSLTDDQRFCFQSWVQKFFDFKFYTRRIEGHILMEVQFENEKFNIVDAGIGISQLLTVLAQIWWAKHKPQKIEKVIHGRRSPLTRRVRKKIEIFPTLLMEQPELYLHADLQVVLVKAIVSAANSNEANNLPNPRFVIETQSEELVSQISNAIYEKEISYNDVQVVMFNSLDPKIPIDSSVEIYKFNKEGTIEDWPFGFFNPRS